MGFEIPERLGKYVVIEMLDRGAMGVVFKARQELIDRVVAIKVLQPGVLQMFPHGLERFLREARAVARFYHPNIITLYDIGVENDLNYFVMEFFAGRSLREWQRLGVLDLAAKLRIFAQVASAIEAAGARNIVHRDLKLTNILANELGRVKVLDFGIAKTLEDARQLTQTGFVVGCANYMSPEQARGEPVDTRSDIFSLGVVMYCLLAGERPFEAPSKRELILERGLLRSGKREPEPLERRAPGCDPALARIVRRCMCPEREGRYAGGGELLEDLRPLAERG